jgi:hypothetical protein
MSRRSKRLAEVEKVLDTADNYVRSVARELCFREARLSPSRPRRSALIKFGVYYPNTWGCLIQAVRRTMTGSRHLHQMTLQELLIGVEDEVPAEIRDEIRPKVIEIYGHSDLD